MSKTVNKFYVTVNGDLEEVHELLVEVARLEDERDNAILERDEAVAKASDLAQELAGTLKTVEATREARERDWEALKSWNKVANEKHEETVKLKNQLKTVQARANFLSSALQARDAHIQELIAEYEKSIESLKSDLDRAEDRLSKSRAQKQDVTHELTAQIEQLRNERNELRGHSIIQADKIAALKVENGHLQKDVKFASDTADDWYPKYLELRKKANALAIDPSILKS